MLRLLKLISLSLFGTLLGLILVEMVFGSWTRTGAINHLNVIKDRRLIYPNNGLYPSDKPEITYTRDKNGLRGNFILPQQIGLLTIGGSTTDQRYISDGETWQDELEKQLSLSGKGLIVANAGIDGQTSRGNIKDFDWWFPDIIGLKPRYVLVYIGLNDLMLGEIDDQSLAVIDNKTESQPFIDWIKERSVFWHLFNVISGIYQVEKHGMGHRHIDLSKAEWTTQAKRSDHQALLKNALPQYSARIDQLCSRIKDFGATPIFVTQPSRWYRFNNGNLEGVADTEGDLRPRVPYADINGIDFYLMLRMFDAVTIAQCNKCPGICIDMNSENIWEDTDFYDQAHMTPKGAKKVGDYLAKKLSEKF